MTRQSPRSSGQTSAKTKQTSRPNSAHSLPSISDQIQARSWAVPHSSGDTMPMNMTAQSEPSDGNSKNHDFDSGNHKMEIPLRSTPQPTATPASVRTMSSAPKDSLEILGCSVKVLLHAIRDLERHGIDAAASVPLPKIVVVGDQSAGKSSLIEAISEIDLPRESGTCTRCVIHISLRNEPHTAWRCDISLVQKYFHAPHIRGSELYPWSDMEQEITAFAKVHDKKDLASVIRRAQLAVLNPGKNPVTFRKKVSSTTNEVPFSPNIISLEIAAPNLPNLSFYDLPGVISQSQDGGKDTVRLIQSLASSYIQQENTIILLTVPMESDIDNSMSSALIDEIPGASERTIGVLTKPDRLQSDDRVDIWRAVLRGQKFEKGHGYFVVKQPSQADLNKGITTTQARAAEDEFFASASWARRFGDEDASINQRLGTRNLQKELSHKLAHLILEVMPSLEQQVQSKLSEVQDELAEYPEPPANAMQVVTQAINDFTQDFKNKVLATEPNDLSESWKKLKTTFHGSIITQRPTLKLNNPESNDQDMSALPKTPKTKVNLSQKSTPRGKRPVSAVIDLSSDEGDGTPSPLKKQAHSPVKREESVLRDPLRKIFDLEELRVTLESFNTSGLPSVVELKAVDHLILETLKQWHAPLDILVNKLRAALARSLDSSLRCRVGQWRTTKLFEEMNSATVEFLEQQLIEMKGHVHRSLRLERMKPITRDDKRMDLYVVEEMANLKDARLKHRYLAHLTQLAEQTGKEFIGVAWDDKAKKQASAILEPDAFDREVDVMAKIRAYYQIASMRFVDQVVQAVEAELLIKFRDDLYHELMSALEVYGENGFANANRLVADDPKREERRAFLRERQSRLEQARERIGAMHHEFFAQNAMVTDE